MFYRKAVELVLEIEGSNEPVRLRYPLISKIV